MVKSMKRSGGVGAIVFAVGFLANLLVFTRNFDTAEEVATYLDENRLLIFIGAVSVGVAGLGPLVPRPTQSDDGNSRGVTR